MSLEWNSYTIEESCELITGFPFKSKYYLDEGLFKVVRGDNVKEGFIKWDDKKRCWNELNDKLKKVILKEEDIVIGMDGSKLGKNRATISKKDLPALLAQRVACVRAKEGFDQNYIKYVILSNYFKSYVDKVKTGTSIPHISLGQISEFTFEAPDYKKQKTISSILSTIDKKITVNQEINKNLEEQLSLLFNDWFVNCTPFKNEELIKSEWGVVPESWKDIEFGELIEITSGNRPDEKSEDKTSEFNIPLFGASKIMGYTKEYSYNEDILIIGRVGTHGVVQRVNYPCFPSDNTFVIKSDYYGFVYQLLKRIDYDSLNTGSTQPLITQKSLKTVNAVLPDEKILSKFEMISKTIFDKIQLNNDEISKLTKLRDTLLPKLMSGEIDVSKINCDLELKYKYMKYLFNQIHTPMSKSVV